MPKFVKKPVVIEAERFSYPPTELFMSFCGAAAGTLTPPKDGLPAELHILTLEDGRDGDARHVATEGDWVVRGISGEFYPIKPDIFEQTYEQVDC